MWDRNAPLGEADIEALDWGKGGGLIPALVQDEATLQLLMLGYMSRDALAETLQSGLVTFHSRSRGKLWRKGEGSGNTLQFRSVIADCDRDALLVTAKPNGPTCHEGTISCFGEDGPAGIGWLGKLSRLVAERRGTDPENSYTARLIEAGPLKVAQKIGEEGVELALAGAAQDRAACIEEAADLLYHLTVLMELRGFSWADIGEMLKQRHR
jgi:phosphoribosyl-ATP pyrophosphohydrolase/phosphoribosyl-AMP cyclohydrolase